MHYIALAPYEAASRASELVLMDKMANDNSYLALAYIEKEIGF